MFKSIEEALSTALNGAIRVHSKKFKAAHKYLEENGYDAEKLEFIVNAKKLRYRPEYIRMCINPALTMDQFEQLIGGINDGMSVAACELIADGSLTPEQMAEIRQCFICGLKTPQVTEIAKAEFTPEEMKAKRQELLGQKYHTDGSEIDEAAANLYGTFSGKRLFGKAPEAEVEIEDTESEVVRDFFGKTQEVKVKDTEVEPKTE